MFQFTDVSIYRCSNCQVLIYFLFIFFLFSFYFYIFLYFLKYSLFTYTPLYNLVSNLIYSNKIHPDFCAYHFHSIWIFSYIQKCRISKVVCLKLDVGCWMLDVGCWMLDVGWAKMFELSRMLESISVIHKTILQLKRFF